MDADDLYDEVASALRKLAAADARAARDHAELAGKVEQLLEILAGQGVLNPGHRRIIERRAEREGQKERPRVKLQMFVDKYQVTPAEGIDCEARLPLCHGRCCAFSFPLTVQDLEEGAVRFEIEDPYLIRHEKDGYCTHLERGSLGCTIYSRRPATCRTFDCRGDSRVWIDYEKRIPAPMPEGLRRPIVK